MVLITTKHTVLYKLQHHATFFIPLRGDITVITHNAILHKPQDIIYPFRIKPSHETSSLLSSIYHSTDYSSVQTATQLFKPLKDQAFIGHIITVVLNITLHRLQFKLQHNCLNPFTIKPSCKTSPLLSSIYHCKDYNSVQTAIIIMYIYHVLINALSAHPIHINLNVIFCTHAEHSTTKIFT